MLNVPATRETAPSTPFDPAGGESLLARVQDQVFTFDDEAFYWLCRRIRHFDPPAVFQIGASESCLPWKFLLERPSDYRGDLVTVEGILRSRHSFRIDSPARGDLGTLHQAELSDVETNSFCTVIVTESPEPIPIRARVRAKGYFLKVRAFRDSEDRTGFAPLLIARSLISVAPPVSLREAMSRDRWNWWDPRRPTSLAGWIAVLLAVLVLARGLRRTQRRFPDRREAAADSADDFEWMERPPPAA